MRTLTVAGVVGSLVLAAAGWTEGGAVAVLVEPGMVRYGGTAALSGHQMVSALRRAGIEADALGVEAVADPERFGAGRVAVLVNPYGNAFPLGAFEAMRAFHRAGGCLVLTGVPFCHPCVRSAPAGWRADGGASWGGEAAWLGEGRGGRRAVRVTNRGRQWAGATSGRFPAKAGQRITVAGWVRARGGESGRDSLFVRFFDGGVFRGQEGPGVPAAAKDWTLIQRTVAVPEKATAIDVSLQVWSRGARVDLDDVSLSVAGKAKNLVGNPGFEAGGGSWRDLGHKAHFAHDAAGIGTGGFGGPASKEGRLSAAKGNPLGLTDDVLARRSARPQWLDPSALAREDEVIPLVELRTPGEPVRLAAALIRHRCRAFRGARDAWLGQVASAFTQEDRYAAEQLVVRAVAWCLLERGKLSRGVYKRLLARLASVPKPEPLPDRLEIVQEPRPWGETFFPKSRPPARELLAVDCRRLGRWERLALTCLQGLTSRQRPRLWLVFGPWDERWLAWHKAKGHIGSYRRVEDWRGLFRQFAGSARGAVVPDERLYRGELLACNLAAVEDCIVAPQALARKLGLKVRHDLRGRFETYAEGMEWLWRTYRDAFSHHLCAYLHPDLVFSGVPAYDIQWRGLIFWVCGEKDADRPGADALAEMRVMAGIFAQMPPNVGMRGFPWHGHGIGLGEGGGVTFCGDYGKALVCTNLTPNVAVMSGVRIERLKPPPQPPTPPLDRSKTYALSEAMEILSTALAA